jgi:hypothetical protein
MSWTLSQSPKCGWVDVPAETTVQGNQGHHTNEEQPIQIQGPPQLRPGGIGCHHPPHPLSCAASDRLSPY